MNCPVCDKDIPEDSIIKAVARANMVSVPETAPGQRKALRGIMYALRTDLLSAPLIHTEEGCHFEAFFFESGKVKLKKYAARGLGNTSPY